MKLFRFLIRYAPGSVVFSIVAGMISGISNAGFLALFNSALRDSQTSKSTLIWSFVGLCLLLPITRVISERVLAQLSQGALFDLRVRLCRKIISAPLRHLEELGSYRLMTALTEDIPTITGTLSAIPMLCINISIALSGLIYLGWLSWLVLLITLVFITVGIITYQIPVLRAVRSFSVARIDAENLLKHFQSLTDGTKELKLHRKRREAFFSDLLQATAASLRDRNLKAATIYIVSASWGHLLVFAVIGMILFALPMMKEVNTQTLTGYTITLLYLMTPLQIIMNTIPGLSRAGVSLKKVEELGLTLEAFGKEGEATEEAAFGDSCERLDVVNVMHAYQSDGHKDNFILGPLNLTLSPGQLVFITGGNGSGKTTLAKLLTGLYVPETGEIQVDGQVITDANRELYRQLFSVVFSDFHLFESLLGLDSPELDAQALKYLRQFRLDHKVEIKDGVLSTTELSQGQRKRLALLTAYMEDRPIYIFDEWAADQDPTFKQVFYHQLLPELKARGKIVLVISHDDQYYRIADRLIKLEYGKIEYDKINFDVQHARVEV
jgi:putative pyoverdin transport system ATP-binding/permease protein